MKLYFQRLQVPRKIISIVSYLLVLLPAALGFLYVRTFGVNLVYGDSWTMVSFFDQLSSGTLGISDLLTLHNGHWLFFPRIATLLLGTITEWNSIAEMYLTQTCLLGTLICLLLALRSSIESRSAVLPLLMVPISLLVFSFVQRPNMLEGFQITFALAQAFGVLALFLLYVLRYEGLQKTVFVAALGSATVASFSAVAGLLVWPAGLLQLLMSSVEKPKKRVFIVPWVLVGLGVWIAYFTAYASDQDSGAGSPLSALAHPLVGVEYFLVLLGNPLFGKDLALVTGLSLACLALVIFLLVFLLVYKGERRLGEYSFWTSVLSWSFLILASIVAARFTRGDILAPADRYTSFSILAIVSIYGLLVTAALKGGSSIKRQSVSTVLLVLLSGAVLLSAVSSYPRGIKEGSKDKERRQRAAFVLSTYKSQSDKVLQRHFPRDDPQYIRSNAVILDRLEYNVFSKTSKPQG